MVWVLGLSGSHNGAAALYRDDELVCAVQEERLSRKKRAVLYPGRASLAVDALLADQGLTPAQVDLVVAAPLVDPHLDEQRPELHPTLGGRPHRTISHHLAHALSAYACSGFSDATALVVDGLGSFARDLPAAERAVVLGAEAGDGALRETVSIYACDSGRLVPREKHLGRTGFAPLALPSRLGPFASLGLMYQQVARLTFGSWDAAGKVMGLAPYGRARIGRSAFFDIARDGSLVFKDDALGVAGALADLAAAYPVDAERHADLAAATQIALEEGLLHLVARARSATSSRRLVCAGGVFLNSVANERIVRSGLFDEVFVVPFAEDSGTAVGAAFHGVTELLGARAGRRLEADALGPRPTDHNEAIALAQAHGATLGDASPAAVAERIAAGQAVGFFAGRSELGPRALGQRSILFDARRPDGKAELNRLKGREPFRPFAPAVLLPYASEWFDLGQVSESPFMLRVAAVHPERRRLIPAVTHVDGSARPQTVRPGSGPLAAVIAAFHAATGVPMVLDTSFNRAGEPIVESACDAVRTFLACELQALWLDGVLIAKGARRP